MPRLKSKQSLKFRMLIRVLCPSCQAFIDVKIPPLQSKIRIVCKCSATFWVDKKTQKIFDIVMGKQVTAQNFIGHYTTWCLRNSFAPMSFEVLTLLFEGCTTDDEYKETLEALFAIQLDGFRLSFLMQNKSKDAKAQLEILIVRLKLRLELFRRVPTATNMLLAYNLIEEITLKIFSEGNVTMDDKSIERFDKLKNLALGTKYINERKIAFDRSVDTFKKLTKVVV